MRAAATSRADNCTTLAPVSPAVAQALHKLQAAILNERLAGGGVPPGALVLLPPEGKPINEFHECGVARRFCSTSYSGHELYLQTNYQGHDRHDDMRYGQWYGSETRVDAQGALWRRSLPSHVVDDFGSLVPVSA